MCNTNGNKKCDPGFCKPGYASTLSSTLTCDGRLNNNDN